MHDDAENGDGFADWFIGGFGEITHSELVSNYGEQGFVMGLYSYPPLVARLADVPQPDVQKFVHGFMTFDGDEYDKKQAAKMKREPVPINEA